jgi:hypothetical protein
MTEPGVCKGTIDAHLAEYEFVREGIRQDQRERLAFLGFALAASGLILGLLMRSTPARSATQVCFLVALAAVVILVAERLTIRASNGVASGGAYIRLFIEPEVPGLRYQQRYAEFVKHFDGSAGLARGIGLAYVGLTMAFVLAWFAAPTDDGREWWQTLALAGGLGGLSLWQAGKLVLGKGTGSGVAAAWELVCEAEQSDKELSEEHK